MLIFPGGSDGKESASSTGDLGWIPGSGRFPGEVNGYPLQYSCLEIFMNREMGWAIVHASHKELNMTEQLKLIYIYNFGMR